MSLKVKMFERKIEFVIFSLELLDSRKNIFSLSHETNLCNKFIIYFTKTVDILFEI